MSASEPCQARVKHRRIRNEGERHEPANTRKTVWQPLHGGFVCHTVAGNKRQRKFGIGPFRPSGESFLRHDTVYHPVLGVCGSGGGSPLPAHRLDELWLGYPSSRSLSSGARLCFTQHADIRLGPERESRQFVAPMTRCNGQAAATGKPGLSAFGLGASPKPDRRYLSKNTGQETCQSIMEIARSRCFR